MKNHIARIIFFKNNVQEVIVEEIEKIPQKNDLRDHENAGKHLFSQHSIDVNQKYLENEELHATFSSG